MKKFTTATDCKRLRKELCLSQDAFSRYIGMSRNWCREVEAGRIKIGEIARYRAAAVFDKK